MRGLSSTFYVGVMVLAAAGVFVVVFGQVDKDHSAGDDGYRLTAVFDDASGLVPKSRITMAGIPIGSLERIELDPQTGSKALVTLLVNGDIRLYRGKQTADGRFMNGASVTRRQASLLGDYYLDVAPGVAGPLLRNGDRIYNAITDAGLAALLRQAENAGDTFGSVTRILENVDRISGDVAEVTQNLATVLGQQDGLSRMEAVTSDLETITGNIAAITAEVRGFVSHDVSGRSDSFGRIVDNVDRLTAGLAATVDSTRGVLARSLANIEAVSADVRDIVGSRRDDVSESIGTIKGTLTQMQEALRKLDDSLANVRSISGKIDSGQGTVGRLINDDQLVEQVEGVVDDASDFVKRLTRLQTRVGLRTEYNIHKAALKTYFELQLQPKEDKYYLFQVVDDPLGRTTHSTVVTQSNNPNLPPVMRESITRTSDDLKFSLMLAKRWYFLTGRFGIIESSGGLGLDLQFWDDRIRVTVDAFDFGLAAYPRMRTWLGFHILDNFFVNAGVDEVIDGGRRDYFFGLGVSFTDDDLKSLLTTTGMPSL